MFSGRRFLAFLISFRLLFSTVVAAEKVETVALSLRQFTNMALQNSLRSRTADESLASSRYGWMASRRALTWPSLTASASKTKSGSDSDTGTEVETVSDEESLELTQPLLTGTVLSLEGAWSRSRSESDTLGVITPSRTRYNPVWSAGVTQPLYIFTGNESLRSRREANLEWEGDQEAHKRERFTIEFDARVLYYDLLLQTETADVERRKYESSKMVTETTQALVRAGKLAEVERVRANIRARRDARQIQNSENNLEKAMNQAKDLISMPGDQRIRLTSKLVYEPFTVPFESLVNAAMEYNFDIRAARRSVELAELALRRAREGDNPEINATGAYSLTRNRSDELAPVDPSEWSLRLGVEWPIFDASRTRLQARQQELALKRARRDLENTARELRVSIQNAVLDIQKAEEQMSDFTDQKDSAERNVRAIRLQYRNGLTRLTDVFDAENQSRELDLEYLNLLVAFNVARDRLKLLVGTGLENLTADRRKK